MITIEYQNAYAEILEILKYISKEEVNKIPNNMLEMFKINANKEAKFVYNCKKSLQENNVSEITKSIIAILYRDYWATEEQRKKILSYQNREREKDKVKKYNVNNLFEKSKVSKNSFEDKADINSAEMSIAIVENKNFFEKIISKIRGIIKRK